MTGAASLVLGARERIDPEPLYRSAHALTLAETDRGLLAAWFGGTWEGARDVTIWAARRTETAGGARWSPPRRIASGEGEACWNPVLHRLPSGALRLFYRVGDSPWSWRGALAGSEDDGESWAPLPAPPPDCLGPIRCKPLPLPGGALLCPSSVETQQRRWSAHVERYEPETGAWRRGPLFEDPEGLGAIQPTLIDWGGGRFQALCRTQARVVGAAWSEDGGESWGPLQPSALPNPNSALDAAMLSGGGAERMAALAYNDHTHRRAPLRLAVSRDGARWEPGPVVADGLGAYAYPALIPAQGGGLWAAWTDHDQGLAARKIDIAPEAAAAR